MMQDICEGPDTHMIFPMAAGELRFRKIPDIAQSELTGEAIRLHLGLFVRLNPGLLSRIGYSLMLKNARGRIRTDGPLLEQILSLSPLAWLGYPRSRGEKSAGVI